MSSRPDTGLSVVIDNIGGNCPVQAEGTVNGEPFYFRARGGHWSMSIGGSDVVGSPKWYLQAPYKDPNPTPHPIVGAMHFAAGWMPVEAAESFIYTAAHMWHRERTRYRSGDPLRLRAWWWFTRTFDLRKRAKWEPQP